MWDSLRDLTAQPAAIPVALAALLLFLIPFVGDKRKRKMEYTVKWGKEKLRFPLPSPEEKLATVRKTVAEYTQLPEHSFKLVHAGAVMKDDNQPISTYGIKSGSKIALIGTGETLNESKSRRAQPEVKAPRTEESTIAQIQTEMEKVRKALTPDVNTFVAGLPALPTATSSAPLAAPGPTLDTSAAPTKHTDASATLTTEQEQEHIRLGELLLQSLLRLDAVNAESEWLDARKERKVAVKEVQGLLDRLDGAWKKAKAQAKS